MTDPVDVTRETYDAIAGAYAERNGDAAPELVADAAEFAAAVPAGLVADIGCGPGTDIRLLRAHGLRVIGVDLSQQMLLTGGLTGVAQADMRALPLRSSSLAGVWSQAAMLHIPHGQVPAVLAEMARVCAAGGLLYLVVAEGDGEVVEPHAYGQGRSRFFAYHHAETLLRLVADAGFEVTALDRRTTHRRWLRITATRLAA